MKKISIILSVFLLCVNIFVVSSFASEDEKTKIVVADYLTGEDVTIVMPDIYKKDGFDYCFIESNLSLKEFCGFRITISSVPFCVNSYDSGRQVNFDSDIGQSYYQQTVYTSGNFYDSSTNTINAFGFNWDKKSGDFRFYIDREGYSYGFVYSSHDVLDKTTGNVVFEGFKENPEDKYNSQVDDVLSSTSDKYSDMANQIANSDFTSSLDENDKSTVSNVASKIGKGFNGIFGIFGFIDSVKDAVSDIYRMLVNARHLDEGFAPGFPIYLHVECPYFSGDLDIKYMFRLYSETWLKDFVDNIICAFVYLGFIWRTFKNLPNIIRGVESGTISVISHR